MRTASLLYLVALAVRLVLVWLFPDPAIPEAYYQVDAARALVDGRGLTVDFVWIFAEVGGRIPEAPALPIASHGHWMPLPALVQVPFIALLGATPQASALAFALIGALAAPLSWAIARDAGAGSIVAAGAGLLVAVPALSLASMTQPASPALSQPLVAGTLWLAGRSLRGDGRAFAGAGLLAGLATLARADGLLVGATLAVAFAWSRLRTRGSPGFGSAVPVPAVTLRSAIVCLALFVALTGPWWIRQLEEFGTLAPSLASGKLLFIQTIEEWHSVRTPATLEHLLDQGAESLLVSRAGGLVAALGILATAVAGIVLVPFVLIGAWHRRRSAAFGPWFTYAAMLLAAAATIAAVHVPAGWFFNAAATLAPHGYVLALEGVVAAAGLLAARTGATTAGSTRVAVAGVVAAVAVVAIVAVVSTGAVHAEWRAQRAQRDAVARAFDDAGVAATDRIMSGDPAGYRYHTGRGGAPTPDDPRPDLKRVALAYDLRWLVVEEDDGIDALADTLASDTRLIWIGPAIYREPVGGPGSRRSAIGVYPICFDADDGRCFPVRPSP